MKKLIFNTSDLDWLQIIKNTKINNSNREAVELIARQWIRYCEPSVINQLLQPKLKLQLNVDKIKKFIVSSYHNNNYLIILKKYQMKNIFVALNCEKAQMLYKQIYYYFLDKGKIVESAYMYIVIFSLWYVYLYLYIFFCFFFLFILTALQLIRM